MFGNNHNNQYIKIKIVGVNTTGDEKFSGGLSALNYMLEKNFSGVNYFAVDRHDIANLAACNVAHKFRLLDMADERTLIRNLRGADMIFIAATDVWENIKLVALTAHCAKKIGAPVILVAGGNFDDAEDEIIFDAAVKLPEKNFEFDAGKIIGNFIDTVTLDGQPKLAVKNFSEIVSNSACIIGYGERDGKNAVIKAAKAAIEHAENSTDNFKSAEKILFNVTAAKNNFSLEEAQKISRLLKRHAPRAEISFGFSTDDWSADKAKFLLVAAVQ